jgi:hypothetical protein
MDVVASSQRLTVGRRSDFHNFAEFSVDEFYIFNRTLGGNEIDLLYRARSQEWSEEVCRIR